MSHPAPPPGYTHQQISSSVSAEIIELLTKRVEGPREAHAALVVAFIQLNEMNAMITGSQPISLDELADDVAKAIRSARIVDAQAN